MRSFARFTVAFAALCATGSCGTGETPSLLVAMLARDEEHLLEKHLPYWREICDCFLLGLDSRNKDTSEMTASRLMAPKPVQIYHFDFNGFGPSKTKLLEESFKRFPTIDYVLLMEPDMYPVVSSFDRAVLKQKEIVYAIRRSGKESIGERLADSAVPEHISDTGWSIVEITGSSRDGLARQHRIREELQLVGEDLQDYPGLPRLTYYDGVLRYELAMELRDGKPGKGSVKEQEKLAKDAIKILKRRSRDPGQKKSQEEEQQRSAAAYFCARAYLDVLEEAAQAEKWFEASIKLEMDFLYAHVALIQMLFQQKRYEEAFDKAVRAEGIGRPQLRLFMDSGPLYVCDIPLLLSKAIYYGYSDPTLKPKILKSSAWQKRDVLLKSCESHCPTAGAETASRKMHDIGKLQEFWTNENASCLASESL